MKNHEVTPAMRDTLIEAKFSIKIKGATFDGARLMGRQAEFPQIVFNHHGVVVNREVAWATAWNCHVNNRPIIIS